MICVHRLGSEILRSISSLYAQKCFACNACHIFGEIALSVQHHSYYARLQIAMVVMSHGHTRGHCHWLADLMMAVRMIAMMMMINIIAFAFVIGVLSMVFEDAKVKIILASVTRSHSQKPLHKTAGPQPLPAAAGLGGFLRLCRIQKHGHSTHDKLRTDPPIM